MLVGEDAEKAEITNIVKKLVGSDDFRSMTITKVQDLDKYDLNIFLNWGDVYSAEWTYKSSKLDVKDILKNVYTSDIGYKINDIQVSFYAKMIKSQTGEEYEKIIYALSMTRQHADQMHWKNIEQIDIENAVTSKYIDPILLRELNKNK